MYLSLQNKVCESELEFVAYQNSANARGYAAGSSTRLNFGSMPAERLGRTCRAGALRAQNEAERARLLHLGLEMDPMLVCLFVMERHPRVRQIVHQVVPVPRRHGRRYTDRRRFSSASTRRHRPDCQRSSPVRDSRASSAVSSRCKRSPLLLPRASKGPILQRGARLRAPSL